MGTPKLFERFEFGSFSRVVEFEGLCPFEFTLA